MLSEKNKTFRSSAVLIVTFAGGSSMEIRQYLNGHLSCKYAASHMSFTFFFCDELQVKYVAKTYYVISSGDQGKDSL